MAIFNSYFDITRGYSPGLPRASVGHLRLSRLSPPQNLSQAIQGPLHLPVAMGGGAVIQSPMAKKATLFKAF